MDFYEKIAYHLYIGDYKIGDIDYLKPINFIEAKHKVAEDNGIVFYRNLADTFISYGLKTKGVSAGKKTLALKEKLAILDYIVGEKNKIEKSEANPLIRPPKMTIPMVRIFEEKDNKRTNARLNEKVDLTERLLIIRYLQNENLFPSQDSKKGDTALQYHKFLSILLTENADTIKKSLGRVEKIISCKDVTKENKVDRLRQLNNVLQHFNSINQQSVSQKISTLIEKVNNAQVK